MRLTDREPERRVIRNRGGLHLGNAWGIRFNDTSIDSQMLDSDRQGWGSTALLIGTNNFQNTDDDLTVLRKVFCELVPLTIVGRSTGIFLPPPLVLRAELKRFPYKIDGHDGYEAFAVRLMPDIVERAGGKDKAGQIKRIEINYNPHGITNEQETAEMYSLDVGEIAHIEVYFEHQDSQALPPLTPHNGFKENVETSPRDIY